MVRTKVREHDIKCVQVMNNQIYHRRCKIICCTVGIELLTTAVWHNMYMTHKPLSHWGHNISTLTKHYVPNTVSMLLHRVRRNFFLQVLCLVVWLMFNFTVSTSYFIECLSLFVSVLSVLTMAYSDIQPHQTLHWLLTAASWKCLHWQYNMENKNHNDICQHSGKSVGAIFSVGHP